MIIVRLLRPKCVVKTEKWPLNICVFTYAKFDCLRPESPNFAFHLQLFKFINLVYIVYGSSFKGINVEMLDFQCQH